MRTLLTVDFDFFVPEDPMWDIGHRESKLFLTILWGTRGNLIDKMKTTGEEHGFWERIGVKRNGIRPIWVSESHCYAHTLTAGVDRIVTFDAHHDCWKGQKGEVSCENWLRVWLKGSKRRRATWVRPTWLEKGVCEVPDDLKDRVDVVEGLEGLKLGLEGPVDVHICRSGCWVPPWLDGAFLAFVGALGGGLEGVEDMQGDGWEALKQRWTDEDLKTALEGDRLMQEAMGRFGRRTGKGYTMMEVPSGDFLKGMVEVRT